MAAARAAGQTEGKDSVRPIRAQAPRADWRQAVHTVTVSNLPDFNPAGDLPPGVHIASIESLIVRFGSRSPRRRALGERLRRVYIAAMSCGLVARFIVFGSFITDASSPNDVDVFLLMENEFDTAALVGEAALVFNHSAAQAYFGASVFWLGRVAAVDGEDVAVTLWQIKRDGSRRGIVEVRGFDC